MLIINFGLAFEEIDTFLYVSKDIKINPCSFGLARV